MTVTNQTNQRLVANISGKPIIIEVDGQRQLDSTLGDVGVKLNEP